MHFHYPEKKDPFEMLPAVQARPFWGENLMLVVVDLEAYAVVKTHNHPQEQAGMVLNGEIEFTIAEETRVLKTGDVYMIPGGIEHSVKVGSEPVQVLDVFYPIREELKN